MNININVEVRGSKRTPASVSAHSTAVNSRTIMFANGEHISDRHIAEWIESALLKKLREMEEHTQKYFPIVTTEKARAAE